MLASSGYRLTFLFIVAIVVPATALALVSITAIKREREALQDQSVQLFRARGEKVARRLDEAVGRAAQTARTALSEGVPAGASPAGIEEVARTHAGEGRAFHAALVLAPDGRLLGASAAGGRTPAANAARLDEVFRPAEDLEFRARAPRPALDKYDEIARNFGADPTVMVEVLAARGRLLPRAFPEASGTRLGAVRAYRAYSELIERYDLVPDRDGTLLSAGARLEIARFWREQEDTTQEALTLEEALRFVATHSAALEPGMVSFYREQALARLAEIDAERASRAARTADRIARDRGAAHAFRQRLASGRLGERLRARLQGFNGGQLAPDERFFTEGASADGPALLCYACPVRQGVAEGVYALALFHLDLGRFLELALAGFGATTELPDDGRIALTGSGVPDAWAAPAAGVEVLARKRLAHPLEGYEVVAYRPVPADADPFAVFGDRLRVSAIGLALLGLAIGAVIMTLAIRKEMRAAQLKSDFVTTVTHELKTPLTSIGMFAETLLMGRVESKEEERECLEIIAKETTRLTRLIERVLTFSKIEAQKKRFELRLVHLGKLVEETVELFRQQMRGAKPFHIEINVVQDLQEVLCDRGAIQEVLLNLLHNAYKYGTQPRSASRASSADEEVEPPPVRIQVTVAKRRGWAEVAVRDWGIGIRARDQRRIFGKFYRANDVLTRDVEGSGIGLTLAKSIASEHRGAITVRSRPGHGSTFSLWLRR